MQILNAILSCISLLVSVFAAVLSFKAQKLQNKVNELELLIKQNEVNKMEQRKRDEQIIKLEAQVVYTVKNNYKLRISNVGEVIAYDVNAKVTEGDVRLLDVGLLPYEILEMKDHFDLTIVNSLSSSRKFKILITCKDERGKEFSKEQFCSLT